MPEISSSKCLEALRISLTRSMYSGRSTSRRSSSEKPMIAFIGVRISWLMLPRNAVLARLADSARSRSATTSAVRSLTICSSRWR